VFFREFNLFFVLISIVISAFIMNLIFGQFNPGFSGQPVAHTDHIWNFGGMLLAGLAFVLGGGCPGRQLILSGEGDGSAAIFVAGMFAGAAFAHNFAMASSPAGTGTWGEASTIIGIVVCLMIGFFMRDKIGSKV
jgi:YedE family putative selenium metabolism protein